MPKLLLFAVCEKVILDVQNSASIINIVHGVEAATTQQGPIIGPIAKNAVAPTPWAIYALWKPVPGDAGKEFTQKIQVLYPDNTEFMVREATFKLEAHRNHQNTINVMGFPVGQVGDVTIKTWIEWDRKRVGEDHSWNVAVTHKKPLN